MTLKRKADDLAEGLISKKSKLRSFTGFGYASTTALHRCESSQTGDGDHDDPAMGLPATRKLAVPSPRRSQQTGSHAGLPESRITNDKSEMIQSVASRYPNDGRLAARADRLRLEALAREEAAIAERDRVIELHNKVYAELETLKEDRQKVFRLAEKQGAALRNMKSNAAAAPSLLRKQNKVLSEKNQELQRERDRFREERDSLKDEVAALKEANAKDNLALKDVTKEKEDAGRDLAAMTKMRDETLAEVARLTEIIKQAASGPAVAAVSEDVSSGDMPAGLDDSTLGSSLGSSMSTPAWTISQAQTPETTTGLHFISTDCLSTVENVPAGSTQAFDVFCNFSSEAPARTIPQPQSVETTAEQPYIGSNGFAGDEIVAAVPPQSGPIAMPSFVSASTAPDTQQRARCPFVEESDSDNEPDEEVELKTTTEGVDDGHGFTQYSMVDEPYAWDVEMQGIEGIPDDDDSWHGFSDEANTPSLFIPPVEANSAESRQDENPKSDVDRQLDEILSMRRQRNGRRNNRKHGRDRLQTPRDEFLSYRSRDSASSPGEPRHLGRPADSIFTQGLGTTLTHMQGRDRRSGSGMPMHRNPASQPSNRRGPGGIMKRGRSGDGPNQSGSRRASVDKSQRPERDYGMRQRQSGYESSSDEDLGSLDRSAAYHRSGTKRRGDVADRNNPTGTASYDSLYNQERSPANNEERRALSRFLRSKAQAEALRERMERLFGESASDSPPTTVRFGSVEEVGETNANNYYESERAAAAARRTAAHNERTVRRAR